MPSEIHRKTSAIQGMDDKTTSLFSILDDKNIEITALRDQLENQKLQLMYYYKRGMDDSKLASISKTCTPDASTGSVSVALAVDHFKRSVGIKSDVRRAYERMRAVDCHVDEALRGHEFLLRRVFEALRLRLESDSCLEAKATTLELLLDPTRLDLMNRLIESTVNLRNRLEAYRICCCKLAAVEEERNCVVDEVFALPPDERMNVNLLANIQAEKNRLEKQLEEMLEEKDGSGETLQDLRIELEKNRDDRAQVFINRLLGRIDHDARSLLKATKRIKLQKKLMKFTMGDEQEPMQLTENVKRAIRTVNGKYFEEIHRCLDAKTEECNRLERSLAEAQVRIIELTNKLDESSQAYENKLWRLRTERDAYRTQAEDLEVIREAYSLLVQRQSDVPRIEHDYCLQLKEKDRQISRLETTNRALRQRNEALARQNGLLEARRGEDERSIYSSYMERRIVEFPMIKREYELMRDCSDESEPIYCAPVRRGNLTRVTQQVEVVFSGTSVEEMVEMEVVERKDGGLR